MEESILPALKGEPFTRDAIFTDFSHYPPVTEWIPPSISVHYENRKLIRESHQREDGARRSRLFDLSNDIGEKNNLASTKPGLITKLDAKIEARIKDIKDLRSKAGRTPAIDDAIKRSKFEKRQKAPYWKVRKFVTSI